MTKIWINTISVFLIVSLMPIATVYKISYPVNGGPDADFQYFVNQIVYNDYISFNTNQQKIKVGNKYLLKYYPPNPKIARVLLDQPLDSLVGLKFQIDSCKGY